MSKGLVLCADDFGLSAAVDRGVLRLVARSRLSALSCLVNMPDWAAGARALKSLPAVRVGLHFNLTEGRPLSPALARVWPQLPPLQTLITQAHLRRLPVTALGAELQAQLDTFEQARGQPPDHIDGHQHVHHLPQLRDLVLGQIAQRPGMTVRHTGHLPGRGFAVKRLLIEGTGGRFMGRLIQKLGRQANTQLLGVYDFINTDYRRLLQGWLAALPAQGGMIFCHPGEAAETPGDPIAAARVRELAYFDSSAFTEDLLAADVKLV